MRWLCLLLLAPALAGCVDAPEAAAIDSIVTEQEAEEPVYRFTLYGRSIESNSQDVTFRIFVDGQVRRFLQWPAEERTADYEVVRVLEVPGAVISYDVVIDGNVVRGATMDVAECPGHHADAFVRIDDHWQARSDYGCSTPGYMPDE